MKNLKYSLAKIGLFSTLLNAALFMTTSCENFLVSKIPNTQLVSQSVFDTDASAISATLGMYEQMMENYTSAFNGQLTVCTGLSSDELLNSAGNPTLDEFFTCSITTTNDQIKQNFWGALYKYIYQANTIIEGVSRGKGLSKSVSSQVEAEARFIRAFSHFYLVNLFGPVPYVSNSDYRQNSVAVRMSPDKVFDGIISDLVLAQNLIGDDYPSADRSRPNKAVVTAFLSRVYLYNKNWAAAEIEASKVIGNNVYSLQSDISKVFLFDSPETLWQMMPVIPELNTAEGNRFAQTSGTPSYGEMSPALINAFEPGDQRFLNWTNSYSESGRSYTLPFKYKVRTSSEITEYYQVIRLAELYLIRGEARANQGTLVNALKDLDAVRVRAGLVPVQNTNPSITQADLLMKIEQERRIELFCEWGHRWLDVKRTNRADAILGPLKSSSWKSTAVLYPIPASEILINSNLQQNPGY